MQPNTEEWQQPETPATDQPHAYVPSDRPSAEPAANSDGSAEVPTPRQPLEGEEEAVRWQSAEYIQRDKSLLWFVIFGLVVVALMAIAILLMKSITFAVLIPVMAAALVVYTRRPPTVYDYTLSRQGLHINDRLYSFSEFKKFGLVKGDDQHAVMLVPRKRFRPGLTVYFPEDVGEGVVDMLAARLPMEEIELDLIDRLIRLLRI